MNKLFTKIVGAALGLTMAIGVGVAVGSNREAVPVHAAAPGDSIYTTGTPSWGTTYSYGEKTLSSVSWYFTNYGNNNSMGWNKASGEKTGQEFGPVSNITETKKIGAYQTSSAFSNAQKITVSVSNIDSVTGYWYVWYSTNSGSSWTQGARTALASNTTVFTYDHGSKIGDSVMFAFGYGTTKTTGTRINLTGIDVWAAAASMGTLSSIDVTTAPAKTKYIPNESFNPTGMVVTATYSSSATQTVDLAECTFSPEIITADGNVTVTYNEKTALQAVTVYSISNVTGVADGHPTEARVNSTNLTANDIYVNVLCDDSVVRTVHPTSIDYDFSSVGTKTVTCTYSYASGTTMATFDVEVKNPGEGTVENPYSVSEAYAIASELSSGSYYGTPVYVKGIVSTSTNDISVNTSNHRATFDISDGTNSLKAYNINGCTKTNEDGQTQVDQYYEVVIQGDLQNYNNGTYEICYNNTAGSQICEIVSSTAPVLVSIEANVLSGTYYTGHKLETANFSVTANYNNGKPSSAVANGFTWTVNGVLDGDLAEGPNSVVVSFGGKTSSVLSVTGTTIYATDLVLADSTKTIYIGTPIVLGVLVEPDGYVDSISWSSSVPAVATVDADGKVAGISAGETVITASITNSNGTLSDTCTVTVEADYVTAMGWGNTTASQFGPFYSSANPQLTKAITDTWTVSATWQGKGLIEGLKFGDYTLKIGEKAINSLPYSWVPEDDGQSLKIIYGNNKSGNPFEKANGTAKPNITQSLNTISAEVSGEQSITNFVSTATVTAQGNNGTPYAAASANQNGITISTTQGYFNGSPWKVYAGNTLKIESTVTVKSITLTFSGNSYAGLNSSYTVNAKSFETGTATTQTRITGLQVVYEGTTTVYYNDQNGHQETQKTVVAFAKFLNSTMAVDGVCGTSNENYGVHNSTEFALAWQDVADKYDELFGSGENALTGDELTFAKNMLANADAKWDDSPDVLQRAMKTYDFVVLKYSSELISEGITTPNFMLASDGQTPLRRANTNTISGWIGTNGVSSTTTIIVIISLVGLTAIGGYFLIRRRKEQ